MTTLTYGQVKGLAQAVGFDDAQSSTMTAIAFAESTGVPTKHNPIPPDDSYGLWQINMYGSMGPQRRQKLGITSNSELYAPAVNAVAAKMIFGEQGFGAWSTYGGARYRLYLPKAKAAVADYSTITQGGWDWNKTPAQNLGLFLGDWAAGNPVTKAITAAGAPVGNTLNSATDAAGQIGRVADAVGKGGNWISNASNWLRIGYVTGGAILAIFALQSLFKPVTSQVAGSALKGASLLPQGKAVKAVTKVAKVVK
jgi:hypothetical protein